jgi:transcriptional regulator GlxA family with amidase domain
MFLQRPGGQSQFSERLAIPGTIAAPIRQILDAIVAEPAADHRLAKLATRAAISERHLRRLFADQTGTTPARFVERIRVEAARERLERTTTPIETLAATCGFGSPETMRRAFLRVLGVGPSDYRARSRSARTTSSLALQVPNQRARRLEPNRSFLAASAAEGAWNVPVRSGPDRKSMSTLPTCPAPNSM